MRLLLSCLLTLSSFSLFAQLTCDDEFLLTGSAVQIGECIRMTTNSPGQLGCAWFDEEIDFSQPFMHDMIVNFGTNDAGGADGICLVYQSNSSSTCGISGEGIGAQSIPNSFIVEFDTWQNANLGDPVNDHSAININGDFTNTIDGPFNLGNIEDGNDHDISFSWDPAGNNYEVYFDGALILSGSFDIINNCFGGSDMAFWGFTSSTGGSSNEHLICPGLPPEVIADAGNTLEIPCLGAAVELDGSNSDQGGDFTYEWTTNDGNIVSGEFSLNPIVDEEGTYTLTVFNNTTLCENTSDVTITIGQIEALVNDPPFLDCIPGEIILDGSGSSNGNDISYDWDTPDGNIVSTNGAEATVDEAGEYTLTVTYDDGNGGICTEEMTVIVEEDPNVPEAFAFDAVLGCAPPFVELDGNGSSEGNEYSYEWTTPDGDISSGENSLFPMVTAAGEYTLVVTNDFTGCTDEYTVFVTGSNVVPEAIAFADDEIPCGGGTVVLDGNLSSMGNEYTYLWTTADGSIVSGEDELTPSVDQPGDYTLMVTNTVNGCTDETTVTVIGSNSNVMAIIATPLQLNCNNTSIILDASSTTPTTGITYNWSTSNGMLNGPVNQPTAMAGAAGEYFLTVTETTTGCTGMTSVIVGSDLTPPIAEAGTAIPLDCGEISLQLNGSGSSNPNATYLWTTADGTILSGGTSLQPFIGTAGTYQLLVTSTTNGCTATDQVTVTGGGNNVVASIVTPLQLTCDSTSVMLDASATTPTAGITYSWSTSNGMLSGPMDQPTATAIAAGEYFFTATETASGCTNTTSVMVVNDLTPPLAEAGTAIPFGCNDTSLQLNGNGSSDMNVTYSWTSSNGTILSGGTGLQPFVGSAGTYELLVTNIANGCTAIDQVTVMGDSQTPTVQIMLNDTLDCQTSSLVLNAVGSSDGSDGNNYTQNWSTSTGTFVGGQDGLQPLVSAPGTYMLSITNDDNGCNNSFSVTVVQDTIQPLAAINSPDVFLCGQSSLSLDGQNSSQGPNFTYQWSTSNGQIVSGDTGLSPSIGTIGTYQLIVENNGNSCQDTALVNVTEDVTPPELSILPVDTLDCFVSTVNLQSTLGNPVANITYNWTSANGMLVGDTTSAQVNANAQGNYQLIAINMDNNCSDTAMVVVQQDIVVPIADAGLDQELTCGTTSFSLAGSNTSSGDNFSYLWTSPNALITTNDSLSDLEINMAGTYILGVTNEDNQCSSNDTVMITQNIIPPVAVANMPADITCLESTSALDGTASTGVPGLIFNWSTLDGSLSGSPNTAQTSAGQEGTYQLVVTSPANGCADTTFAVVTQDSNFPTANIAIPVALNCDLGSLELMGTASSVSGNTNFDWVTLDGNLSGNTNTLNPTIDAPGTYTLNVEDVDNNCMAQASVLVVLDTISPVAIVEQSDPFGCSDESLQLNASNSTTTNATYIWTTSNGEILSGANSLMPVISTPGTYSLMVTNSINNCIANTEIVVTSDDVLPDVFLTVNDTLDCDVGQLSIDALGSSSGSTFSIVWSTVDGNIVSGNDGLEPMVNAAGTYELAITNSSNGCSNSAMVIVAQDTISPVANIAVPAILNCEVTTVNLSGNNSSQGNNITYAWTTSNGTILTATNLDTIRVGQVGNYNLLVTNTDNGCAANTSMNVDIDDTPPVAEAGASQLLNCDIIQLELQGNDSAQGSNITYAWSSVDGNIQSGSSSTQPMVNAAGTYSILVTNTDNNCTATDMVLVNIDTIAPSPLIASPDLLTCQDTVVSLDASGSMGSNLSFVWSNAEDNPIENAGMSIANISQSGLYSLLLENTLNGCENQAEIMVQANQIDPTLDIATPDTLDCNNSFVILNAGASSGGTLSFSWSTPDGEISVNENTASPTVTTSGTYNLLLTDTENACTSEGFVVIADNSDTPAVFIEMAPSINCDFPQLILNSSVSSNVGNNPSFVWSTLDGNIVENGMTSMPTINQGGTYQLVVTNTATGCSGESDILIRSDLEDPVIALSDFDQLDCATPSMTLDASASTGANTLAFAWSSTNGNITSLTTQAIINLDVPGEYQLILSDVSSGCADTLLTTVNQDTISPIAMIATPEQLDCMFPSISLNAAGSSEGMPFQINWTTVGGQIDGGDNTLLPTISQPGSYQLDILNTDNSCEASAQVQVTQDDEVPVILFAMTDTLNCAVDSVSLDASLSSMGPAFSYNWTTTNGQIVGVGTNLQAIATEPGQYTLSISNSDNNCSNSAILEIAEDVLSPIAQAGDDFELNCGLSFTNLNGLGSSQGNIYTYEWTALAGENIQDVTSLTPQIMTIGTYQLVVTNTVNACTASDQVTVTQDVPLAMLEQVNPLCFGETGSINFTSTTNGTPPYLYSIDGGQSFVSNTFFTNLPAGQYPSLVEDSNGCTYEEVLIIEQPDSVFVQILEPELEITFGDSILVLAESNYLESDLTFIQWQDTLGLSCVDCLTPYASPVETSFYRLTVATEAGCRDEALLRIIVRRDFPIYIPNAFSPDGENDNDFFYIFAKSGSVKTIRSFHIYDRWGNQVYGANDFPPNDPTYGWDGKHNGQKMNSAVFVYAAEIELADGRVEIFKGDVVLMR